MISNRPLACIATRNDLRKIFFTARRWFPRFSATPRLPGPGPWPLASGQITTDHPGTPLSYLPETPPSPTRHHSVTFATGTQHKLPGLVVFCPLPSVSAGLFVAIGRGFIIIVGKGCVSLTCLAMSGTAAVDDSPGLSCEHTLAWKQP